MGGCVAHASNRAARHLSPGRSYVAVRGRRHVSAKATLRRLAVTPSRSDGRTTSNNPHGRFRSRFSRNPISAYTLRCKVCRGYAPRRTRRGPLHLSYSCASPVFVAMLAKQPTRTLFDPGYSKRNAAIASNRAAFYAGQTPGELVQARHVHWTAA